jgi:hypothetical protein
MLRIFQVRFVLLHSERKIQDLKRNGSSSQAILNAVM